MTASDPVGEVEMSPEELRGLRELVVACAESGWTERAAMQAAAALPALIASVDRVQELTRVLEWLDEQLSLLLTGERWHPCDDCRSGINAARSTIDAALNPAGSDASEATT